jgi:hypothetical protein
MNVPRVLRAALVAPGLLVACAAALASAAPAYRPRVDYQLNCQGCHLADGSGEAGRVPSVRRMLVPFAELPAGRAYLIQVPGVSESSLSDAATAALLNWMARRLSDVPLPRRFVAFTAAEVARRRGIPLANVTAARARVERALAAQTPSRASSMAARSTDRSPM